MKNKQRTDKRGRVLRGAEDRRKLVEAFKRSGLSQSAFCRAQGLHNTTFSAWVRQSGEREKRFAEVTVPIGTAASIEVELPNGARVRLPGGGDPEQTATLIRRVAGC
jgi:transposase-like protein